ncbi:MAG: IS5 family transposase [Chloroflexus sp.]|nr:IS5 family transposase [Chloroflexus aurantiacus]
MARVVAGRDVGAHLAHAPEPPRRRQQAGLGTRVAGRQLRSSEKRGTGGGTTKVGKGSKVMVVVDGTGVPIGLHVASAHPHERTLAEATVRTIRVPRRRGRPSTRPNEVVADNADDRAALRSDVRRRGITPTMPSRERRNRQRPKRGRPLRTGASYQHRWTVERCFAWMDTYRRLVVRYDRHLHSSRAFCLVAIMLWCVDRILK